MFCIYLHACSAQDLKFLLVDLSSELLIVCGVTVLVICLPAVLEKLFLVALVRRNEKALNKKKLCDKQVFCLHFETLILDAAGMKATV